MPPDWSRIEVELQYLISSLVQIAEDCNTLYGLLNATMVASAPSASAGDCCNSCKGTTGCTAWNYCYCELGCAGGIAKGTCQLKNLANAFYPE